MTLKNRPTETLHISNSNVVCVDVDETLLMWERTTWTPNHSNINALIREFKRGKFVIVWSKAGAEAARRAVDLLKLGNFVSMTMAKPDRYIDDKDASEWMHRSYYKGEETSD